MEKLGEEVTAWQTRRDQIHAKVNWQFTTDNARVKLKRLYRHLTRDMTLELGADVTKIKIPAASCGESIARDPNPNEIENGQLPQNSNDALTFDASPARFSAEQGKRHSA